MFPPIDYHYSYEFGSSLREAVLDTTLCDKVCCLLSAGCWFSTVTPIFSTNKTDYSNITEILMKVVLNINRHIINYDDLNFYIDLIFSNFYSSTPLNVLPDICFPIF